MGVLDEQRAGRQVKWLVWLGLAVVVATAGGSLWLGAAPAVAVPAEHPWAVVEFSIDGQRFVHTLDAGNDAAQGPQRLTPELVRWAQANIAISARRSDAPRQFNREAIEVQSVAVFGSSPAAIRRQAELELAGASYWLISALTSSNVAPDIAVTGPRVAPDAQAQPAPPLPTWDRTDLIESIPKDLAHYRFDAPFSWLTPSRRGGPTYDDLARRRAGRIEITFTCTDRNGRVSALRVAKPLVEVMPDSDAAQQALQLGGELILPPDGQPVLAIGHRVLDQLEQIARRPEFGQQPVGPGQRIYRGSECTFTWQIVLHDEQGEVARSPLGTRLKYVVRQPVVFLPGTAGSRLAIDIPGGGLMGPMLPIPSQYQFWPPESLLASHLLPTTAWAPLCLDEQGQSAYAARATDIFRYYGLPVFSIYIGFLRHMDAQGYRENQRLFLFPYDWRLDIAAHGPALDRLVDGALAANYNRQALDTASAGNTPYVRRATDQVVLIGHSQGGLVAQAYLLDDARAAKVQSVIMLGTPHLGAAKTFQALCAEGYSFETPFLHSETGKWVGRNWYSVYQMLPVDQAGQFDQFVYEYLSTTGLFWNAPNPLGASDYHVVPLGGASLDRFTTHMFCSPWLWAPGRQTIALGLNPARLEDARKLAAWLHPRQALRPEVEKFLFASYGTQTPKAFRLEWMLKEVPATLAPPPATVISHEALRQGGYLPTEVLARPEYPIHERGASVCRVALPFYHKVLTPYGDGTVTLYSAMGGPSLAGACHIWRPDIRHGGLTEAGPIQQDIDCVLAGIVPSGAFTDCAQAPTLGDWGMPFLIDHGIQFSVHGSPANIHAFDARGRHTGLTPDGRLEMAIPGSTIEVSGQCQEVAVPLMDQPLEIRLEGLTDTRFDFRVSAGDGRQQRRLDYLGLPETPRLRGSMQVAWRDLGRDTVLHLDIDGDGQVDQTRRPDFATAFTAYRPSEALGPGVGLRSQNRTAWWLAAGLALVVVLVVRSRRRRTPSTTGGSAAFKR